MKLLETSLVRELPDLAREGVRVSVMGELGMVTPELRAAIADAVDRTRDCSNMSLCVALSYGSRHDVVRAARELVAEAAAGLVDADDVTEETFAARLSSARTRMVTPAGWSRGPVPAEPDLLVRSGGESRLSNFMLWELAYTELLFADAPWPEFGEAERRDAMATYAKRQRRFGGRGDVGKREEEEEEEEEEEKAEEEGRRV
jgi:undecaprenyl diphosphate synthase